MANHNDDLGYCNNTATLVVNNGVKYYEESATQSERTEEHNTLVECLETAETDFRMGEIGEKRLELLQVDYTKGLLVIAGGDYLAMGRDGPIANQYSEDILEYLKEYSKFNEYDIHEWDEDFFQRVIADGDDELFEFVEEVVIPRWDMIRDVLDGDSTSTQMKAVKSLYNDRSDTIYSAIEAYLRHRGWPTVKEDFEDAIQETQQAANARVDISAEIDEQLTEFTDQNYRVYDEIMAELQSMRTQFRQDMAATLENADRRSPDVDSLIRRVEELLEEQEDHHSALEEQIASFSEGVDELDSHIANLEDVLNSDDIDDQTVQLVKDELARLREERQRFKQQVTRLEAEREEFELVRDQITDERGEINPEAFAATDRNTDEETDAVLAATARIAEFDYTSRFETAVHEADSVTLPDGSVFEADSEYWSDHHERTDERHRMRQLLAEHTDNEAADIASLLGNYPLNRSSRFTVVETSKLGLQRSIPLTIEVVVTAHLEQFARYDADTVPADETDLLEVVNAVVSRAEDQDTEHLVAVASPTGWTDNVIDAVERGETPGAEFSRLVSLLLVDLRNQEIIPRNPSDDLVAANYDLFTWPTKDELSRECAGLIRETYVADDEYDYVHLETVVRDSQYTEPVVSKAFTLLEDEGVGTQIQTGYGLCLDFDG